MSLLLLFGGGTPGLSPDTVLSGESVSSVTITASVVHLYPNTIAGAEGWGSPALGLYLIPSSVPSAESFGTVWVLWPIPIFPDTIPSTEGFGGSSDWEISQNYRRSWRLRSKHPQPIYRPVWRVFDY